MTDKIVRMVNVSFAYPKQVQYVLAKLNLEVSEGAFVALLGLSGCGKTTLLNLLLGYLMPSKGTCYVDDVRISGPDPSRIPIFQEDSLWPWLRVPENVTLFTRLSRGVSAANSQTEKARDLLERVGLQPDIDRKYTKELSVGMRKRVEIARALFATPKVILADEPFGSLDPETRAKLHQLIQTTWDDQGLTIIFSTHDIAEAIYLASEIVVLQMPNGKVGGIFTNPLQGKSEAQRKHPQSYYLLHDRLRCAMRARGS